MNKRIHLILLICVFLFLSACQNNNIKVDEEEMAEEESSGALLVRLGADNSRPGWLTIGPLETAPGPIYDKLRAFQEEHPDLVLELLSDYPYDVPDPFPDILELTPFQIRWVVENELEQLESVIQLNGWSGAYANLIERTNINGTTRMVPLKIEPMVVYYDQAIFNRLKIALPHEDWTWDEFVAASRQLNADGYNTDIPETLEAVEPIIKGLGGSYTSPNGDQFTGYLDSVATAEAFDQFLSHMKPQLANKAKRNSPAALGIAWPSSLYSRLTENVDLKIASMPVFPDGQRHNTMFTTGLVVSAESSSKTEALKLISALIDDIEKDAVRFTNYHVLIGRERGGSEPSLPYKSNNCWTLWKRRRRSPRLPRSN